MADETPQVDEQEQTGTPIVPAEVPDLGNEVTFTEPKTITEMGKEVEHDTPSEPETPEIPEVPEPAKPVQVPVLVQNPGEFKSQDYSFEAVIKGKSIKVTSVEEAEALADDPENFTTPKELLDFMRKSNKMENGIEKDKLTWEQSKAEFDRQQEAQEARQQEINTISAEINYLVQKGELPPIAKEYQAADWSDPLVAKQPGVREQVALLKYMGEENDRRQKAGLKNTVSALDAFNGWKIEEAKVKADLDNKTASQQRKDNGAKVASSSAAPITNRPKGVSVGRVGNLNNLSSGWN